MIITVFDYRFLMSIRRRRSGRGEGMSPSAADDVDKAIHGGPTAGDN
jgi:hypothetical protein